MASAVGHLPMHAKCNKEANLYAFRTSKQSRAVSSYGTVASTGRIGLKSTALPLNNSSKLFLKPSSARLIACLSTSREGEAEARDPLASTASMDGETNIEVAYDTQDIEDNPQLHPLRDALMRARQRRDESMAVREKLEAEAQEVAQLAVEAGSSRKAARRAVEDSKSEIQAAEAQCDQLRFAIAELQAKLAQAEKDEVDAEGDIDTGSGGDAASMDGSDQEDPMKAIEAEIASKEATLAGIKSSIESMQRKLSMQQSQMIAAEEAYAKADNLASEAMEAAEEAVKNEMDYITVCNDTEGALIKAIEDLKFMDNSSDKREQDFDTRNLLRTMDEGEGAVTASSSIAAPATSSMDMTDKPAASKTDKAPVELEEARSQTLSLNRRLQMALILAKRNANLLIGAAVVLTIGGYFLHSQGAFSALIAKAQASAVLAGKAWAVAAEIAHKLPLPHVHESEAGILETIWLLLSSVITVPLICKLPGGSPVLGFLAGGALIGPYALGIIQDVESIRHLAELGVVFLLFNIGLELSFDRLRSMGKFVFGMGTAQVVLTMMAVAYSGLALLGSGLGGPGALILGGGLALSTTAVGMQVLQDRGETGSRHGRAAFSVLLLQDFAVVVLLMLIPLLAPGPDGAAGGAGLMKLVKAIGFASIKAVVCMAAIIVTGRTVLQPVYKRVADTNNPDLFAALTLLVVLSTSLITQVAGLSLALGAFLAGLLLAETDYHIQVESDIAPYKGLLMGLFFMTVGMEISVPLFFAKFKTVIFALALLISGKVAVMMVVGKAFGLNFVQSLRSGLLLSPGGEFAFVLFGEAVSRGIMGAALAKELYLVVALSMALTPFLAEFGGKLGKRFESSDMKALQPKEGEMSGMSGHVIIAGYGRSGQLIAQMLAEELIPFVALDTNAARVQEGKAQDLPLYFGDAGSPAVLHALGADRAACAVITLDSASANYRSVYTMQKHFPEVKTYCRAVGIQDGIMLEKAGATAVVPEVLEPSLQLAAAVLSELNMPDDDVAETIRTFRKKHLAELQMLASASGSSLGYGGKEKEKDNGGAPAGGPVKESLA